MLAAEHKAAEAFLPQLNTLTTEDDEGRLITDQRVVNLTCSKLAHPPAGQSTHRQVCRELVWWNGNLPDIVLLLSKKDIKSCFKLFWIRG